MKRLLILLALVVLSQAIVWKKFNVAYWSRTGNFLQIKVYDWDTQESYIFYAKIDSLVGPPGSGILAGECSDSCDNVRGIIRDTFNVIPLLWENIAGKPSCFTACSHNHTWSEITNPPAIPDQYDSASVAGACAWNSVSGKPSTFPPSAHDQNWSTITDQPSIPAAYDSSVGAQRIGGFYPARFADTTRFKACSVSVNSRIVNDSTNAFELVARKGAASGYAGLGANGCVPTAQLGSGSASSATYLRGDQTWATPAGGGGSFNPGAAIQMETMDSWDAVTKYVAGTANRGYWQPVFLSCSLIVTKFMFRGRRMRGSDFGVYDSLGVRLWSTGISNGALSALCSLTVTPNLRLGPGQYYIAWACSSASYDTLYGVAQPVAGMIQRAGYKATSCPLPASIVLNTLTLDVRRLWFNLRRY